MSRPDLYDLYIRSGASDLIDRATAADVGIGVDRVERVLIHLLLNGDVNGQTYMGTPRIADQIRLSRQRIEEAFAVLEASGLAERTGARRSRAIVWQLLPKQLEAERAKDDVHGEVHGEMPGEMPGEVPGIPGTKGREGKGRGARARATVTNQPSRTPPTNDQEPICDRHPDPRHDDPCRKCADWRRWRDDHALDNHPAYRPIADVWADLDRRIAQEGAA